MKTIVIAVVLMTSLFNCNRQEKAAEQVAVGCSEIASVVDVSAGQTDFKGLDGCGLMLELEDGTRLNPEKRVYIQAPKQEDDPLYYFTLTAGDKVKVTYRETNGMDACMAGKRVFITCITKID